MSRLDNGLENGINSGSENRLGEIKKQHMHALAEYRHKLYREPKLKELFSWIRTKCKTPERDTKDSQDEVEIFAALKDIKLKQIPDDNKVVSTEVKAFTTTGETRDRVRIDLYEYALGQLTIYEGKKHITSSKDVYQLRMYWDGLVFDGIKPKRGILIARQHPESVKTLIRIVNSMQDANGNNYNFITKTWDDEGVPV